MLSRKTRRDPKEEADRKSKRKILKHLLNKSQNKETQGKPENDRKDRQSLL